VKILVLDGKRVTGLADDQEEIRNSIKYRKHQGTILAITWIDVSD